MGGAMLSKSLIQFSVDGWGRVPSLGLILGVLLCLSQQYFGWLKMEGGYVVDVYPVIVKFGDILLIFSTVVALGFCAACYPVRYLPKKILTQ